MRNTGCMNKFYALRELYAERRRFIHDITIPLNLQPPHYPAFLNFLRLQLGPRVVFKFDCQQEGRGVVFRDLAETGALERVTPLLERARTRGRDLHLGG